LGGVAEQIHDNGAFLDGLLDLEEVLARHPAILHRFLPAGAILTHANDDVEAIVAEVEALAVALRAIADEGESVIFEVVLAGGSGGKDNNNGRMGARYKELVTRPVVALVDVFLDASEVNSLDTAALLYEGRRSRWAKTRSTRRPHRRQESALLHAWGVGLTQCDAQRTAGLVRCHVGEMCVEGRGKGLSGVM